MVKSVLKEWGAKQAHALRLLEEAGFTAAATALRATWRGRAIYIKKDLVVSLKMRAVQENRAYSAVVQEAIEEYLSKTKLGSEDVFQ